MFIHVVLYLKLFSQHPYPLNSTHTGLEPKKKKEKKKEKDRKIGKKKMSNSLEQSRRLNTIFDRCKHTPVLCHIYKVRPLYLK